MPRCRPRQRRAGPGAAIFAGAALCAHRGAAGGGPRRRAGCAGYAQSGRTGSVPVRQCRTKLDADPALAPAYAAVRRAVDDRRGAHQSADTATLEKLLGRGLRISPTRFEKIPDLPFGYFCSIFSKAPPAKGGRLAPNISGTLTHWSAGKRPAPPGRRSRPDAGGSWRPLSMTWWTST